MNTLFITIKEIETFIKNKLSPEEIETQFGIILDDETELSYYSQEDTQWDLINNELFTINPETETIHWDPKFEKHLDLLFKQARSFTEWISRSYDNETFPWENNAWDEDIVHGDDDVDYNSSYIDILIDTFEYYLLNK